MTTTINVSEVTDLVREVLTHNQREQTAATILAALIHAHATANAHNPSAALDLPDAYAGIAARWADALRAELSKGAR